MAQQVIGDELSVMLKKKKEQYIDKRGCTDRINRLRVQYYHNNPTITVDRARIITRVYKETEGKPTVLRKAQAFYAFCNEKPIEIQPDELIVGNNAPRARAVNIYPETSCKIETDLDTVSMRKQDAYYISEEDKKFLREEIFPYWKGKTVNDYCQGHMPEEVRRLVTGTDILDAEIKQAYGYGHAHLGLENILIVKGFQGIEESARESLRQFSWTDPTHHEKIEFLNAVIICCQGIKILGERHAQAAREMATIETNATRKKELLKIAEICEWVPYNPPRTFHEMCQAVWFGQTGGMMEQSGPGLGLGRFDQYAYPYYQRDLENGIITPEEAQELIECLWIKNSENVQLHDNWTSTYFGGYQYFLAVNMGGVKRDGTDAVNDITYMMMQATDDVRLHAPSLAARVSRKNPEKYLTKIAELVKVGTGFPQIHNDDVGIQQMLMLGVDIEDAYDYHVSGCSESTIAGKMWKYSDAGQVNLPIAIDFVFYNGYSNMKPNQERWGVATGDATQFKSYEEFKAAVFKQIEYLTEALCIANMTSERAHINVQTYPYTSALFEGCVETGTDFAKGGCKYNVGPAPSFVGLADIANSLASIKKFVYEEKVLTMAELIDACRNNFEGQEDLRLMLLNRGPKYGNDDEYVDAIAQEIANFCATIPPRYNSIRGCKYTDAMFPVATNTPLGKSVGALPSGRKAGVPIADGVSPQQGTDKSPTSVIKSVCSYDHVRHANGNLLNMRFTPGLLEGKAGTSNLVSLIKTFLDLGGWHIQFNVVDSETLKDAQQDPEKYPTLMVRVAGYSAYFNDLCTETQNDIISRTEHATF